MQIYQLTTAEQFARILSDETLAVSREEQALEAALEWVEYDKENRCIIHNSFSLFVSKTFFLSCLIAG